MREDYLKADGDDQGAAEKEIEKALRPLIISGVCRTA